MISQLLIKTEFENKHKLKQILRKEIKGLSTEVKSRTSALSHQALLHRIRTAVKRRISLWTSTHQRKLQHLRSQLPVKNKHVIRKFLPNTIHNLSTYQLSRREQEVLCYSLDQSIPSKIDQHNLKVEFESFYQSVLPSVTHLSEDERTAFKTRTRVIYDQYSKIKVSYDDQMIINGLRDNKQIVILKQDKGRGVVIVDRSLYIDKAALLLDSNKFKRLNEDPTNTLEGSVQRTLRSIREVIGESDYWKLYPRGSKPAQFYGTAKIHKMKSGDPPSELPLRPIVSNIGTATYKLSKHLAQLLSPLTKSEYSVDSTKHFIDQLRDLSISSDEELVSFDVSSLFTNVPLDETINIILDRIYVRKEIDTKIKRKDMKKLLDLCTKNVHFTFDGKLYLQIDGVAMGSPLGPVLANIFMVELERFLVPSLNGSLRVWKRYVDDTFAIVKRNSVDAILNTLNRFHRNITFTHEIESGGKIAFLDVLVERTGNGTFESSVYRKPTNTDLYIHWQSYAPEGWKVGTLKTLIHRAYTVCSTPESRRVELDHLKRVFSDINGYPRRLVNNMLRREQQNRDQRSIHCHRK